MDTPGSGKYMKQIMKAIWMADAAIIVVQDWQLFNPCEPKLCPNALRYYQELAICVQAMGLKQIILAISIRKENIGWDHYDKIVKEFANLFKRTGFSENNIRYQLTNTEFLPKCVSGGKY